MILANLDIREEIKNAGVCNWHIANRMGVNDSTFSRWLRTEMSEERKTKIRQIIAELTSQG